ncbi:hypothetical protein ACP8HI_26370 [Paenibacillus sp. FA6]
MRVSDGIISYDKKTQAILALHFRTKAARHIADEQKVSHTSL